MKKYNFLLVILLFCFNILTKNIYIEPSLIDGSYYFTIPFIAKNTHEITNKIKLGNIFFYFQGKKYIISLDEIKNTLCCQINMLSSTMINSFYIIISEEIIPIFNDDSPVVNGWRSSNNAHWYNIAIEFKKNRDDFLEYFWTIKKINPLNKTIPDNSIIIESNPSIISLPELFKNEKVTLFYNNNVTFKGFYYLPEIYIDFSLLNELKNEKSIIFDPLCVHEAHI